MMATILTLRFLTSLLFLFTNAQGISVKDLKVKLGDQTQVDSKGIPYIAQYGDINNGQGMSTRDLKVQLRDQKQVDSKDIPYITQYRDIKPNYAASYTTTKHNNNLPRPKKISQPYTSGYNGYKTSPTPHKENQANYIVGYRTRNHDSNGPYIAAYGNQEAKQSNYIVGYRTHTHDSNGPYIAAYGNQEAKEPNYIAGYRTRTHESNGPYKAAYGDQEAKEPNYIAGYRTHNHDSNGPYIAAYGNQEAKQPNYITGYRTRTHDSNGPYIAAYGNHEAKQPNYITGYRTHTHGSNGPYIASYGNQETKKPNYITGYRTLTHDSNGPYIAAYGNKEAKQPNYITGYRTSTHDSKGSLLFWASNSEDSNGPQSFKGSLSPNMDRTEAFKTGFFTLDDLYVGSVMTLQFPVQEVSPFLSRKEADSIPLSMSQIPSVLQLFSIPEDSPQAKSMRGTLEQCEGEAITGETKTCANSLESMLEFVDKIFGSDTKQDIITTSYPSPTATPLQKYTILEVSHDIDAPKWVACHPLPYPYAVHYCHFISTGTKVFKVSLVGEDNGDKVEALGICHLDTSDWMPDHIVFKQLNIKAGKETPVCHFFPVNHLMWIPQSSKGTM